MRIAIDLQGAQSESRYRGIGRYTMSLTRAILKNNREHEIFLLLNGLLPESIDSIRAEFCDLLDESHFRVWYAPGALVGNSPDRVRNREIAVEIRAHVLQSLAPDVVLISSLFESPFDNTVTDIREISSVVPTLVILYDLIPLVHSEIYLQTNPEYARYYLEKVEQLKLATAWLTISEHTACEGAEKLGFVHARMVPISAACDDVFRKMDVAPEDAQASLSRLGISRPFVLYTGGVDKRKNLTRLLEVYASLDAAVRAGHQLVLAGKVHPYDQIVLEASARSQGITEDELIFTGYVEDRDLCMLYNRCRVFVFPSWHEGFGLPALEAMSCGAPVIGANLTSVPEVIGRDDALFDPFDHEDMRNKLLHVLNDAQFRNDLAEYGTLQATKFSWDHSARMALQACETYAKPHGSHPAVQSTEESLIEKIRLRLNDAGQTDEAYLLELAQMLAFNRAATGPRQLLVDISELVTRDSKTGIQRVTRSILMELLKNPPQDYSVRLVYATQSEQGYRYANCYLAKLGAFTGADDEDCVIDINPGDIFLGLDLQHHVVMNQEKYLHFLHRHGVKTYFVVYDLLPVLMPHVFGPSTDKIHQKWLSVLVNFDGALCISRSVAEELKNWLLTHPRREPRPFKVGWFHLGADIKNSSPSRGLPEHADAVFASLAQRRSFLMVGTVEPRKGHRLVLEAFEQLWADGDEANLVIVGQAGWMVESLIDQLRSHPEREKRLFWLEGISDEYLEKVYASSTCLIAASEGEGFGLPLIEAAQHKLPIIARDIPVFREVAGDHAWYFDSNDASHLAQAIKQWLQHYEQEAHPRSDDLPFITWAESARQLLDNIIPPRLEVPQANQRQQA